MFYRLLLLIKKEFLQFSRNIPLLFIVLYGATLDIHSSGQVSMDIHNYPLAIYDLDHTQQSREIIGKLREPFFKIIHVIKDEKEITGLIERGIVSVAVVIPEGFGKKISSYKTASMQVILDGANSNSAQLALGYINNIIDRENTDILIEKWQVSNINEKIVPYVGLRQRNFFNPNLIDRWKFSFDEFCMIITLIGVLLTATAMVNEKQFGTIEQLMVTPLRTYEIMAAKVISMMAVLFVSTFIAIFVTLIPMEGMPLLGDIWSFFAVSLLYFFVIAGIGLFISTVSNNLSETILFSYLILVPMMFLSGKSEGMAPWMAFLMNFSPLKYYMDFGYGIFLKGNSIFLMWREVLALLVLGVTIFAAGAYRFRKVFR
jgi:ABC-2 type transport system permease protein